jgi:hypothetical protein
VPCPETQFVGSYNQGKERGMTKIVDEVIAANKKYASTFGCAAGSS